MKMRTMNGCIPALRETGISFVDACDLRRIAMTLHRWYELECGDGNDHGSWSIERVEEGWENENSVEREAKNYSQPYLVHHSHQAPYRVTRHRIPDREKGAHKRLAKIMERYPTLRAYLQTDPRGSSLYILRPNDVPPGADVESCYNRGVAVYK